jgi:hypothetical protein
VLALPVVPVEVDPLEPIDDVDPPLAELPEAVPVALVPEPLFAF